MALDNTSEVVIPAEVAGIVALVVGPASRKRQKRQKKSIGVPKKEKR
jgi:hypothetical protein